MLHPSQYFTEDQVKKERDFIQASLKERSEHLREAESRPPVPKPPRICKTAADKRNYREEFLAGVNWPAKLSEATEEEYALEAREKQLLSVLDRCNDLSSDLTREQRANLKEEILGYNFPSAATKHHDRPTMLHRDGLIDMVRSRLAEIRKNMPMLVRSAQAYLDELKNVPTEAEIFAARQRENQIEELVR